MRPKIYEITIELRDVERGLVQKDLPDVIRDALKESNLVADGYCRLGEITARRKQRSEYSS